MPAPLRRAALPRNGCLLSLAPTAGAHGDNRDGLDDALGGLSTWKLFALDHVYLAMSLALRC